VSALLHHTTPLEQMCVNECVRVGAVCGLFCPLSGPLIPPRADITYEVELLSVSPPLDVAKVTEEELVDVV